MLGADTNISVPATRLTTCRGDIPCDAQYVVVSFEISHHPHIHDGKPLAPQSVANHDELLSDCPEGGTGVSCQRTSTEI
jgi:hypothetical protein